MILGDIEHDGRENDYQTNNQDQTQTTEFKTNKKTGARVGKTIGALALVAAIGLGTYFGIQGYNDFKETKRAESLVVAYMDQDSLVELPASIKINQAYDEDFCDGEKLAGKLTETGAEYCYLDGKYYTPNGDNIAILTFDITRTETVQPQIVEYNGTKIYIAPSGYILNGGLCEKIINSQITKIVPSNTTGDYSNVSVTNVTDFKLVNVEEVQTLPYEEMYNCTLVCDVPDNAVSDENGYCNAELRLIPRR